MYLRTFCLGALGFAIPIARRLSTGLPRLVYSAGVQLRATVAVVVCACLAAASNAEAGGYEFPGDGARAIGRGGAFAAKADDPMAVVVNPAALASMPGTQLWFSSHIANAKDCFNRNQDGVASDGTRSTAPEWPRGWGVDSNGDPIPYGGICTEKNKRLTVIPSLGVTWRVSKRVGMGFTFVPPNSGMSQRWGSASYDVVSENGSRRTFGGYVPAPPGSRPGLRNNPIVPLENGEDLLPSPVRFQLVERQITLVYPTFAVGAKPFRWLQLGAAFGWGIADVRLVNNIRNVVAGEQPSALEGQADLRGQDWFVPRVSASLHLIPHDKVDIVAVIRWDDAIRAKGDLSVGVPSFDNEVASGLNTLEGKGTLVAPRPWWVTLGIRYSERTGMRPVDPDAPGRASGRVEDSMTMEKWDIEADVTYERNSIVESLDVQIEDLQAAQGSPLIPAGGINTTVEIGHNWQDQLSLRLGGDWNAIPGKLAVRGGFSYETNGFTKLGSKTSKGGFVDFLPLQRFGLHVGLSGRIKRAELTAAFTYFWNTTHHNGNGGSEQIVVTPVGGGAQEPGETVNNGAYSSRIVVGSIAFRYFFKGRGGRGEL